MSSHTLVLCSSVCRFTLVCPPPAGEPATDQVAPQEHAQSHSETKATKEGTRRAA